MTKRETILIIDDQRLASAMLRDMLKDEYDTILASSGMEGLKLASETKPSLILLDIVMKDIDGYEVIARLKNDDSLKDIPIIFISALNDIEAEKRSFSLGAVDYITKPYVPIIVQARIATHIKIVKQTRELEKKSSIDYLTGLSNRHKINEVFKREWNWLQRTKDPLVVVLLDVDYFKNVNDTYGHFVGDKVLKKLSDIISSSIRVTDISGRWGGEEFIIICPRTDTAGAMVVIKRLQKNIRECEFPVKWQITCSFGAAEYSDEKTMDILISKSDTALYKAKKNGRNRIECYRRDLKE